MTAPRTFTYDITFLGGGTVTVAAANKASACRLAEDLYADSSDGGSSWAAIENIARSMATARRPRATGQRTTRSASVNADGEAPL